MHDINLRGWYGLIAIIPLIGLVIIIYWECKKGDLAENRFGSPRDSIGGITLIDILLVFALTLSDTPSSYFYDLVH